jgi:hypothetical protein
MPPSLTLAMHQAEQAFALPSPTEEEKAEDRFFVWDQPSTMSECSKGASGQGVWVVGSGRRAGKSSSGPGPMTAQTWSRMVFVLGRAWRCGCETGRRGIQLPLPGQRKRQRLLPVRDPSHACALGRIELLEMLWRMPPIRRRRTGTGRSVGERLWAQKGRTKLHAGGGLPRIAMGSRRKQQRA